VAPFTLRSIEPDKLNSATKYPSILTYHTLGNDGGLSEPVIEFTGTVIATEKVDGCNARIILMPDGSFTLGSREDLLYAEGDYLTNKAHGLVEALLPTARDLAHGHRGANAIHVVYVELYGGRKLTTGSQEYTGNNSIGFRLFDIATIPQYEEIAADWDAERIAGWRDHGGQTFFAEQPLANFATVNNLTLTPRLLTLDATELPREINAAHTWLTEHASTTQAALDEGGRGRAEGIVLRSTDRTIIAKMRFQNYRRTQQLQEKAAARR
jgi:hypothetical protein